MTVALTPTTRFTEFTDLVSRVPRNGLYLHTAVDEVLPFQFYGAEFSLEVSEPGIPLNVTISRMTNNGLYDTNPPTTLTLIPKNKVEQVRLPLTSGINDIRVESALGSLYLRIGVGNWLVPLYVFARDLRDNVTSRLETREQAVLSRTGSLLVERWFRDVDLLPKSNSLHRLSMRMLIDGFSRRRSRLSLEKITAGVTANTPIFQRIGSTSTPRDSLAMRVVAQEEFAGSDTHVWLLDRCAADFVAAGKYIENFPALFNIETFSESVIAYTRTDDEADEPRVYYLRNFEGAGCSIEDTILEAGCFDRIRPWVRFQNFTEFKICYATYPFDLGVEHCGALGTTYFDCEDLTPEETITDPDMVDHDVDPTGDGWVGHGLTGRWDFPLGGTLDTMSGLVEEFIEENTCPYPLGAVVTPLMTCRTDLEIDAEPSVTVTINSLAPDGIVHMV